MWSFLPGCNKDRLFWGFSVVFCFFFFAALDGICSSFTWEAKAEMIPDSCCRGPEGFGRLADASRWRIAIFSLAAETKKKERSSSTEQKEFLILRLGRKFKPVNPILWTRSQLTVDYPGLCCSRHSALRRLFRPQEAFALEPTCYRASHRSGVNPTPPPGRPQGATCLLTLGPSCQCDGMMVCETLRDFLLFSALFIPHGSPLLGASLPRK